MRASSRPGGSCRQDVGGSSGVMRSRRTSSGELAPNPRRAHQARLGQCRQATVYLQDVLGWRALQTALAFLPGGVLIALGAPRTAALVTRTGPTLPLAGGMTAFLLGYLLYPRIESEL